MPKEKAKVETIPYQSIGKQQGQGRPRPYQRLDAAAIYPKTNGDQTESRSTQRESKITQDQAHPRAHYH